MTHNDIYTKFMIEYDKANVTSSYPSLTEYEVATVLDKAYNALIAQKFTGNNVRRVQFEQDVKNIEDLRPLIITNDVGLHDTGVPAGNVRRAELKTDHLYFVSAAMRNVFYEETEPMDGIKARIIPVNIVNHKVAENFFVTTYNLPWIKNPVAYIEDGYIYFVFDSYKQPNINTAQISYIRKPKPFVKENLDEIKALCGDNGEASYFWFRSTNDNEEAITKEYYTFELSDTVAEELISLAIAFALENVESQRLNSKLNMRGLEA